MKRTLEVIEEELRLVREERKPLHEAIGVLDKKIAKLEDEVTRYKLNNSLYHPMSELEKYKDREISHIILVERDEEGALDTEYIGNDEMFSVDENGHLDYSSYHNGVMHYDDDIGMYVEWCYGTCTEHDYVGFLEIKFEDED